jgi:hypothetical protein
MKTKILLTITAAFVICGAVFGQSLEQQFQEADAELNRVYKELRSQLNEEQKAELKKSQLTWIKEKDLIVKKAKSENNKIQLLFSITSERANYLKDLLKTKNENLVNNNIIFHDSPDEKEFASKFGIKLVYQSAAWDDPNVVCEAQNKKYRAISKSGSNKIYIFDKRSRLMLGEFSGDAGHLFENDPYLRLHFTRCGKYIYGEKSAHKGLAFTFTHVPSLTVAMKGGTYRSQTIAPIGNNDGFPKSFF